MATPLAPSPDPHATAAATRAAAGSVSTDTTVTAGDVAWRVRRAGREGPVVLLLHGTGGSTHQWDAMLPALAERCTVVAPDLPGHAGSTVLPGASTPKLLSSIDGMATALAALMRRLGLVPTVVAGHSAGAAVAVRMALDAPAHGAAPPRAIVGLNPALVPPPFAEMRPLRTAMERVFTTQAVARGTAWLARNTGMLRRVLASSGAQLDALSRSRYETLFTNPLHVAGTLAMMSRWELPALVRDARALATPLVCLAGAADRWVPTDQLARVLRDIPRATLTVYGRAGHLLPEEAPGLCAETILAATA